MKISKKKSRRNSNGKGKKRGVIRVINLRRFVMSIIILLGVIFSILAMLSKTTYSHGEIDYKIRYVTKGETLWSIAKEQLLENEYYSDKDIRFIIEDLREINNLKNGNVTANQELKIPTID